MLFIEPNMTISPEVPSSPGKKVLWGSMVDSMLMHHLRVKNIHQAGQEYDFFLPKSQRDVLSQFITYIAGHLDLSSLGRKAYLQRSTGISIREGEALLPHPERVPSLLWESIWSRWRMHVCWAMSQTALGKASFRLILI